MREPKPYWRDVPKDLRAQIGQLLGSSVRTASRVFGGYGPSATFRLFLEDGRTVFAKGAGTGSNEENWRVVPLEESVYRDFTSIRSISPAYYGSICVDGWHLLFIEDLKNAKKVPPWTEEFAFHAIRGIAEFHLQSFQEADKRTVLADKSLSQSWRMLRENADDQASFLNLFPNHRKEAENWLWRNIDILDDAASELMREDQPWGLIHTDIRSDNLRFRGRDVVLFDWPSLSRGPLICDVTFFAPSVQGEGGPIERKLLAEYKRVMGEAGVTFPSFAEGSAAAATAGYFAARAGKPEVAALPRLRQVQKLQFGPALQWAVTSLGLSTPPGFEM